MIKKLVVKLFVYCFDENEKNKLQKSLRLFGESIINNKQCWIFLLDNNKINFTSIDRSKCFITNRMAF